VNMAGRHGRVNGGTFPSRRSIVGRAGPVHSVALVGQGLILGNTTMQTAG